VIACFYTDHINLTALGLAVVPLALFALCVQRQIWSLWPLLPLALLTWAFVHESGVHATVAGVLLGFTVPVLRRQAAGGPEAGPGLAEQLEHLVRPISAGVAVPVFAFFAAGVAIGGYSGLATALRDPIALGIVCGLVVGKAVGIFGTTRILAALTRAALDTALRWVDVFGMSLLAGIGFTVSLLIGDLAYGTGSEQGEHVKIAVLTGSVVAAVLAAAMLRLRNRHYRSVCAEESRDDDHDGVPDLYRSPNTP
jgi:Na+:H+ antiporter, NhaA family